jgi:hypothetical protein
MNKLFILMDLFIPSPCDSAAVLGYLATGVRVSLKNAILHIFTPPDGQSGHFGSRVADAV